MLAQDVQVVQAGAFDVTLLAALHEDCFGGASDPAEIWSARALAELLAMPGSFALLAREADRPCGYLFARDLPSDSPEDCEILSLGVLPDARRRGVARELLGAAWRRAAGRGTRRLILEVAEDNRAARMLYQTLGFRCDGRRDGYYKRDNAPPIAALLLSLDLVSKL